jgi:dynein heavy chain, axonemal
VIQDQKVEYTIVKP